MPLPDLALDPMRPDTDPVHDAAAMMALLRADICGRETLTSFAKVDDDGRREGACAMP